MSSASEPEKIKSIVARFYNIPDAGELKDIAPTGEFVDFPEVIRFDYFESIYESLVQAKITILDSAGEVDGAFNNCGIRQFCPVEIDVIDPAVNTDWERTRPELNFVGSNCFLLIE